MPKTILHMSIQRLDGAIEVYVKSEIGWEFARSRADGSYEFCGQTCLKFKAGILAKVDESSGRKHAIVFNDSSKKLFIGENVNGSIIQCSNILDGVLLRFEDSSTTPTSRERLKKVKVELENFTNNYFKNHIKPIRMKVVITTTDYEEA